MSTPHLSPIHITKPNTATTASPVIKPNHVVKPSAVPVPSSTSGRLEARPVKHQQPIRPSVEAVDYRDHTHLTRPSKPTYEVRETNIGLPTVPPDSLSASLLFMTVTGDMTTIPRIPKFPTTMIPVMGQAHTTARTSRQVPHTAVIRIRRPLMIPATNPSIIALCIHPAQCVQSLRHLPQYIQRDLTGL